jgi:CubicO group peptidase (beta-lactamase class C family)
VLPPLALLALVLAASRATLGTQESGSARPTPAPIVVEPGLGEELDAHARALAALGFNGSVLIAKGGQSILCKGYGLAQRQTQLANTPDTLFDIGSLTKQFTAAAILKLEEQGKLATSDRLSKYVGKVPKDKAPITLRQLLTHTSGLPREVRIGSATVDRDFLVEAVLSTELRSQPGAEFCYTNAGYDLLGAVVEIVSQRSFEDYVKDELFARAGLVRTAFLQDPSLDPAGAACGYEASGDVFPAQSGWYSWGLRGAGGVLSSVIELERWWRALDGGQVLSAGSREALFTPELLGYACGWWVREDGQFGRVIEHAGTTRGFESSFARYPDKDLLVIVLSNERETCKPTAFALARTAAGLPVSKPPVGLPLEPEKLRQCEGTFVATAGAQVTVRAVGARLALQLSPEAVVLLSSGRAAKSLERDRKLAARVEEIVLAMRTGDANALIPLVSTQWPGWHRSLVRTWREWSAERGAYERVEVLGAERVGDYERAFVRLDFDSGSFVVAMLFRADRLSSFEVEAGLPSGPAFVAVSETEFGWMDPASFGSRSFELHFERDARGRAKSLMLRTGSKIVRAERGK